MSNTKVTVELDWDTIDNIIQQELQKAYECLSIDLENCKEGKGIAIFHHDKDEDVAEITKHLEAFKIVAKYYGKELS